MNRIGGKSNSGEGGEDPIRALFIQDVDKEGKSEVFPHLKGLRNGDLPSSRIKQVSVLLFINQNLGQHNNL
jgi:glutamate synthase (ferredoxin)